MKARVSGSYKALYQAMKVVLLAGPAIGQDLRIAIGNPEPHAHAYGPQRYAEYLGENSSVKLSQKCFLCRCYPSDKSPTGCATELLAWALLLLTGYKSTENSETNLISGLLMNPMIGEAQEILAAAMSCLVR